MLMIDSLEDFKVSQLGDIDYDSYVLDLVELQRKVNKRVGNMIDEKKQSLQAFADSLQKDNVWIRVSVR